MSIIKLPVAITPIKPQLVRSKGLWAGILVLLLVFVYYIQSSESPAMLLVDGQPAAVVTGKDQVDQVIEKVKADLAQVYPVSMGALKNTLSYDEKLVQDNVKSISDNELYNILKEKLDWQVNCWSIYINDRPMLYLASEEEARKAVEGIKQYYLPAGNSQLTIEQIGFAEDVKITSGEGPASALKTPEEAIEAMVKGLDKIIQHTVKSGESLWTIARDSNMTVAELRVVNPDLKGDLLKPGQKLNLVKAEPLVRVAATVTTTVQEKVLFSTVYENDSSLWRGQQRVKQPGSYGSREVTYRISKTNAVETSRETLMEKILLQPIAQVVTRGTKVMTASRGDGGSGLLGWPTRDKINSPYGKKRGRKIHTGTDIDGEIGDPIYASGSGRVLEAGWKGNYGKCIIIDHGSGLSTLYGHLNSIDVVMGQEIIRGDVIGKLGTTGKSTGPHLHFEVRLNGVHQNPMKYLEQ